MNEESTAKRQRLSTTEDEKLPESPFSSDWQGSDAVLVVEGCKLYVHTLVLSLQSPVFKTMFSSTFVESKTKEVLLPGKNYKNVENLLKMIYPGFSLNLWEVSLEDVDGLLSLAQEYMIDSIRNQIEKHLSHNLLEKLFDKDFSKLPLYSGGIFNYSGGVSVSSEIMKILKIADNYDFHDVICKGAKYVSERYFHLNSWSKFSTDSRNYKFRDKYIVKFMAHIINKQTEKIKSDINSARKDYGLMASGSNVSQTLQMLSDIETNSKIMMEASFLKVDN